MTGLLNLPGNRVRSVFVELGERDHPHFMIPLILGEMEGLQWRRVRPGGDLERPTLPITWIVLIDDRGPGAAGPSSFDAGTLQWLFADAFQIAIDAAEPKMELYEWFVEEGLKGKRILIVQTVESRRAENVLPSQRGTNGPRRPPHPRSDDDAAAVFGLEIETELGTVQERTRRAPAAASGLTIH
jgi:hypothetical protein